MKKILTISLLLFLIFNNGFAQSKYTDSLSVELNKAMNDTSRVLILADLSYYHRYQNLDTALAYAQRTLSLSKKISFSRGESISYQVMGVSYRLKGELSRSLEHIYKALQIAEDNNYKSEIAYCFMRLSLVFSDLKDFDKAISLIQKSFQIFGSEKRIRVNAINNLQSSNNFEGLNKLDTAWYYAEKAYNQLDIIEDLTSDVCRSAGNIQFKTGNRLLSFKFYKEAYDYALSQNDYRSISLVYAQLAIVYRKENNRDSSIYYAKQGLEYAQRSSNRRGILACGNLLAEIYEVENPADALRFYKIAAEAKEGLFGTGNLQAIQALLVKEEERQNEIERAKAVYQAQLKQYGLLGIVVVFLVVALPLYRNNQNRKKTNEQLLQQN